MDLAIIIGIILINTIISLILFNINEENQLKSLKTQNKINKNTIGLFKDLTKGQIELYSKVYDLELKNYIKEAEE